MDIKIIYAIAVVFAAIYALNYANNTEEIEE